MKLREIMDESLMQLEIKANEKEEAIYELTSLLEKENRLNDKDVYIKAVLKREAESTTGIGFGVAIPHGKSSAVKEPSLCFGRSTEGITYDSMDGEVVHMVFLIAVPEDSDNQHLRILAQLSRKLMHDDVRKKIMNAQTKEEIYTIIDG